MYGLGFLKSFRITVGRFVTTYVDDLRWFLKGGFGKRYSPEALAVRQSAKGRGVFTVQYPKEKLPLPENYRGFPFLVIDPDTGKALCTACGICAKACPPQCIWIVRATDPETGKPKREAAEFVIDVSICMSCGFCVEFCTFDAIKMDNDYEIATYERDNGKFLWDLERLSKPLAHHAAIHPTDYAAEKAAEAQKAARKKAKQ
ncbi:MAG: 4Fe-4S binding protein [Anaerolineae bacterium]